MEELVQESVVTGSLEVHFEDKELYDQVKAAHEELARAIREWLKQDE